MKSSAMRRMGQYALGLLGASWLSWVGAVTLPGPVVDVAWLDANRKDVQVVEVRADLKSLLLQPEFETNKKGEKVLVDIGGRIPDARVMESKRLRVEREIDGRKLKYLLPTGESFEKLMQSVGVDADRPTVLVPVGFDVSDISEALRMYWTMKVFGDDNVAVLDGGAAAWNIEGKAVTVDPVSPKVGTWKAKGYRAELVASTADVRGAMDQKSAALVDGRGLDQFFGLSKRAYVGDYGHIDGAKALPPELLVKSDRGAQKFLPREQYLRLLAGLGIDANAKAPITYCNSGHLATSPWFVLSEVVGNRSTRLYDGSLYLWTLDKQPMVSILK